MRSRWKALQLRFPLWLSIKYNKVSRAQTLSPIFLGHNILVQTGNSARKYTVVEDAVGFKAGEFGITKKLCRKKLKVKKRKGNKK